MAEVLRSLQRTGSLTDEFLGRVSSTNGSICNFMLDKERDIKMDYDKEIELAIMRSKILDVATSLGVIGLLGIATIIMIMLIGG